ncbi:MAG: phosphoribosyltransferase family protein, partial [Chitinophagaceae bacterium]
MTTLEKKYILNQAVAEQKMRRMALEIIEDNHDEQELILVGIRESGSVVARNMQRMIAEISPVKTQLITISLDKSQPRE